MSLKSIQILGVNVTVNAREEVLEYVGKYLLGKEKGKRKKEKLIEKPLVIVTPNPEQVVLATRDRKFAQILNRADVALPDGIGISLAMILLNKLSAVSCQLSARNRIPGVEFMEDLVGLAAKEGIGIGLIGGRGGVAVKALECLKQKHPKLQGWAEDGPEVKVDQLDQLDQLVQLVVAKIRETQTRMVFVGLGAPKQEYFIQSIMEYVLRIKGESKKQTNSILHNTYPTPLVFMSVGGSFDILAGRVARAPFIMRHSGLEWLWRLTREPWRWKRQLALLKFCWLIFREYIK